MLESYNPVAITEIWWDELQDWSVAIDDYKLFRRGRGRRSEGDALYIKKVMSAEMSLNNSHDHIESNN